MVWLPAGIHVVERGTRRPSMRLLDFTGDLLSALALPGGLQFSYRSTGGAYANVDRKPVSVELDGSPAQLKVSEGQTGFLLRLPRGQHVAVVKYATATAAANRPARSAIP